LFSADRSIGCSATLQREFHMRRRLMAALLATGILPAAASDPQSWAEYEKAMAAACFAATGFKKPAADSAMIGFSDTVSMDAMIVTGIYPQAHMNNAKGRMLCLYNKANGTASAAEITDPQ
jgi:hypothetical protein